MKRNKSWRHLFANILILHKNLSHQTHNIKMLIILLVSCCTSEFLSIECLFNIQWVILYLQQVVTVFTQTSPSLKTCFVYYREGLRKWVSCFHSSFSFFWKPLWFKLTVKSMHVQRWKYHRVPLFSPFNNLSIMKVWQQVYIWYSYMWIYRLQALSVAGTGLRWSLR